jgi:hypothetical protein
VINARPDLDGDVADPQSGNARQIAQEQFAHGLLESLHRDGPKDRERRIAGVIAALAGETEHVPSRWLSLRWPLFSGMAAAIALVALVMLAIPAQRTAEAMVQASLSASAGAGDRRYEVHAILPHETELEKDPIATLDVRDSAHTLVRARSPWGDQIVLGHDEQGTWGIRPDGSADRYPPARAMPRWIDFGKSTVLLSTIDDLMTTLGQSYTLKRLAAERVPSGTGPVCDRVRAEHKRGITPEPPRVELWLDSRTHLVRRMELHWNPPPPPPPPPDDLGEPPPDGGPDGPPGMDDGPPPPPPEGEPPPPHPYDDGLPPGLGPDGLPLPPPPPPEGADGQRPPPGRAGRPPHPPPEFLGGPPDFAAGHRPPPPRLLVFELVDGVKFPDGWFDPATHATK